MCHSCVIDRVKERMLSRRQLFRTAAAGAALAATSGSLASGALAQGAAKAADLTHDLHENFPTYFGTQQFFREQKFSWAEHKFNLFELRVNEHTGTHMDAPLHFSEKGNSVAEIPVEKLICPLCVIDVKAKAAENADYQLTPDDIKAWTDANGPIPDGACVALNSGWDKNVASDKFRNADGEGKMHFPGFHIEAANMLMETGAAGIAVDTLSLDYGMSPDFVTHYAWLGSGHWGLECIANLDALPAKGATLIVGAPKVRGGTGGPTRAIALM